MSNDTQVLRATLETALARIEDMLADDDGQAFKEARKFLESARQLAEQPGFVEWLKTREADSYSCSLLVRDALARLTASPTAQPPDDLHIAYMAGFADGKKARPSTEASEPVLDERAMSHELIKLAAWLLSPEPTRQIDRLEDQTHIGHRQFENAQEAMRETLRNKAFEIRKFVDADRALKGTP